MHRRACRFQLMVHYKPVTFVLQPDEFANGGRDLNHVGQIMLTHLGHYFFYTFLVGIPAARARRTGVAMGCLVSSEE